MLSPQFNLPLHRELVIDLFAGRHACFCEIHEPILFIFGCA